MSETDPGTPTRPQRINDGPGRVLLVVYVVFAISAGARAVFQIATQFSDAPVAFGLSAFSAVVYLVAAVAIGRGNRGVALVAVWIELVGVLAVGLLSVVAAQDFPRSTVWSDFGAGYGFVPVILPILGLLWLRRHRPE
ncbi:hypothetical protein [Actinomycetospora sp.]|uniref:hypothetical protein n=1 Tax=Actinomycetospora sp. TaxID=1872135 RepID=UPI002F3FC88E